MSWKEFFKPTIWKIIITLILTLIFFFYWLNNLAISCPEMLGYDCSKSIKEARNFVIIGSIISVIGWYLISCLITLIYNKLNIKKGRKKR